MSTSGWNLLCVVHSLDEVKTVAKSNGVCPFDDFLLWQRSCWLVVPLESCTCPVGLKVYPCQHSVGLAIVLNLYQVSEKTRVQPLGKRRGKGRPKKVNTAYGK